MQENTFGVGLAVGIDGSLLVWTANHFREYTPDFQSGLTSTTFTVFGYDYKRVEV